MAPTLASPKHMLHMLPTTASLGAVLLEVSMCTASNVGPRLAEAEITCGTILDQPCVVWILNQLEWVPMQAAQALDHEWGGEVHL